MRPAISMEIRNIRRDSIEPISHLRIKEREGLENVSHNCLNDIYSGVIGGVNMRNIP